MGRRTTPLTDAELVHLAMDRCADFEERARRQALRLRAIEAGDPSIRPRTAQERELFNRVRTERAERELRSIQRQIAVQERMQSRRGAVS